MRSVNERPPFPPDSGIDAAGMTLRDHFAAAALAAVPVVDFQSTEQQLAMKAQLAYRLADAMLDCRERLST